MLTFVAGGHTVRAEAGAFVDVPHGVVHEFVNPTDEPARMLLVISASGSEEVYEELTELYRQGLGPARPQRLGLPARVVRRDDPLQQDVQLEPREAVSRLRPHQVDPLVDRARSEAGHVGPEPALLARPGTELSVLRE